MRPPYCACCNRLTHPSTLVGFADYSPLSDGVVGHPDGLAWFCDEHVARARRYRHLPLDDALKKMRRFAWWDRLRTRLKRRNADDA